MIGRLRAFGALAFWSAVVMVAMSPVMLLLHWLRSGGGDLMWWWTMGLLMLLLATIFVLYERWARLVGRVLVDGSASGGLRVSRHLRVPSRYGVVLGMQPVAGVLAIVQTLNIAQGWGVRFAVTAYAFAWSFSQFLPWVVWARNRQRDPLPSKQGIGSSGGVRVWNPTAGDEGAEHVEVAVRPDRESSFAEVLRAVVRTPVLPAIRGGERTWLVLVDGSAVGTLTQTWEHPRWWPEIVWSIDASDPFDGERIRFEPDGR